MKDELEGMGDTWDKEVEGATCCALRVEEDGRISRSETLSGCLPFSAACSVLAS